MKTSIVFPFLFYATYGQALEPLPDEALSLVAHNLPASALDNLSKKPVSNGAEPNTMTALKTPRGDWVFITPQYTADCEDATLDDGQTHTATCDQKQAKPIPQNILSNKERLDGVKNLLPTRDVSYKWGGSQQVILNLDLDANIALGIGNDGEVLYLEGVTLTENGEPASISIGSRIQRGDEHNGISRLEMVSNVALDGITLDVEKIKILKNEQVVPMGQSMGGLRLGNVSGYANSTMFYHE